MLRLSAHFLRRNSAKLAVKRPLALSSPSAITRSVSFLRPSTLTSLISTLDPTIDPFFKTQVRWKRKDGARFSREQRQPSRKERHKYHLKLKAKAEQEERHANPGYKSRPLKEFNETFKQAMLDDGPEMDLLDNPMYGVEDAVLDDLIGNSSDVSSTPTPEPKYFGHKHGHYSNKLKMLMNNYQEQVLLLQAAAADNNNDTNKKALIEAAAAELPDEKTISMALRAYRDEQSTRLKPVGLVKALTYLLQKHNVPLSAFGENTYTTLLTCCRTAKEGRKVLSIMRQEQVPISDYAWSILVDIYAKTGDYLGAAKALDDMLDAGVPPTLPAFTSFFAACYKVANDGGRVAHSIRAKAANLAFEKWQQMRVVGIDPDAMAYGAMLRLCAAQGRPEQAINMLEEMQQMGVKPTTLCFTSALRAVSKSHATMIRYENGASKRNRKREYFTGHHGNMARTIVILAENAEVKLDDGFTAALIMCAANAGDAATAKAVYIASQVRRLDQFRTIGTDEHLARLRGEVPEEEADDDQQIMISAGEDGALSISDWTTSDGRTVTTKDSFPSYERREYGKDSRVLSALLHACAVACGPTDIGTIWQGRENEGYLCPNSLRLINAKKIPEYHDMSIPHERLGDGMISKQLDVLDEDYRPGKRQARKFDGLDVHEDHPDNSLEVSDQFAKMYWDEDGNRKKDVHNLTHNELWHMKYGIEDENREFMLANGRIPKKALESREPDGLLEAGDDDWDDEVDDEDWSNEDEEDESVPVDMRFDQKTQRWSNVKFRGVDNPEATESLDESTSDDVETVQEEEMYFDTDAMKWATRLVTKPKKPKTAAVPPQRTEPQTPYKLDEKKFNKFYKQMKADMEAEGMSVSKDEARAMFMQVKDEISEELGADIEDVAAAGLLTNEFASMFAASEDSEKKEIAKSLLTPSKSESFDAMVDDIKNEWMEQGAVLDESDRRNGRSWESSKLVNEMAPQAAPVQERSPLTAPAAYADDLSPELVEYLNQQMQNLGDTPSSPSVVDDNELTETVAPQPGMQIMDGAFSQSVSFYEDGDEVKDDEVVIDLSQLAELREILPGLSDKRLEAILRLFRKNLSDPPLLELTLLVREKMPDYLTNTWLKSMSRLTSHYVVQKASEEGLVDIHMVNGVLEIEAASGGLRRVMELYDTEFSRLGLKPNEYSNRLVLQMFLNNDRFRDAMMFKQRLKMNGGQRPDLASYGSLIQYCASRGQFGSGVLLLKECLRVHGAKPGEATLKHLRILGRQNGRTKELESMIGVDPVAWLKDGEANRKREMSKKGRRNVVLPRNLLLQV